MRSQLVRKGAPLWPSYGGIQDEKGFSQGILFLCEKAKVAVGPHRYKLNVTSDCLCDYLFRSNISPKIDLYTSGMVLPSSYTVHSE